MMDTDIYIAYALAAALLIFIPGPIVTLTIANSLRHGSKTGCLTVLGASSGSAVLLAIGGFGMAWAFELLSEWFSWIRLAGAAYLIYLGFRQWRSGAQSLEETAADRGSNKTILLHGFIVAITNPKTILFYAAFFPQFLDPARPTEPQLLIMGATFVGLALLIDGNYALMAGRLQPWLQGEKRGRIRNRITGSLLIGTGIALAFARKP